MVGIADVVSTFKYAWNAYWMTHVTDAICKFLNGTVTIFINDALDANMQLSEDYYEDYEIYGYRGDWTLAQLMDVAWDKASTEVAAIYSDLDDWSPPEHLYVEVPRLNGPGPRFDLAKPTEFVAELFGYLELAYNMLIAGFEIIGTVKTALLNINPLIAGTTGWYFEDPADPGVYKTGANCTPVQGLYLADIALWYGMLWILNKIKPLVAKIGRAGAAFLKYLMHLLFKTTKSAASWAKNRWSRERLINSIVDGMEDEISGDIDVVAAKVDEIDERLDQLFKVIGLRLAIK